MRRDRRTETREVPVDWPGCRAHMLATIGLPRKMTRAELIRDAARALEVFGDDELERYVDEQRERERRLDGCRGHPAGPFDPMGQTVYCDGSCRD